MLGAAECANVEAKPNPLPRSFHPDSGSTDHKTGQLMVIVVISSTLGLWITVWHSWVFQAICRYDNQPFRLLVRST